MDASMKSSAVAFIASKRSDILPSKFEQEAAKLKASIKGGLVTGISFPKKGEKLHKPRKERTDEDRKQLSEGLNKMILEGCSVRGALAACGITKSTHEKWCKEFGLQVAKRPRTDMHDMEILELVQSGESMEEACGKFNIKMNTWRMRMLKQGHITSNNKQKPKSYYAERVAKVRALVADKGITITAACEEIGFPLPDWNRYKYLA